MSNSENKMNDSDFFICAAFRKILKISATEEQKHLDRETKISLANYLIQLPPKDKVNPAAMANHITAFCENPGNERLNEWLGEIYDRLDADGIDKLVKKTGDPDDDADGPSTTKGLFDNEGRDILEDLQKWANEINKEQPHSTEDDNQPTS